MAQQRRRKRNQRVADAHRVNMEEAERMNAEHKEWIRNQITCALCGCRWHDGHCDSFTECKGCYDRNPYCCSDCKRAQRKRHQNRVMGLDHGFQPQVVPEELRLRARHTNELVKGGQNVDDLLSIEKWQVVKAAKDSAGAVVVGLAEAAAQNPRSVANAALKLGIKSTKVKKFVDGPMGKNLGKGVAVVVCAAEVCVAAANFATSDWSLAAWETLGRSVLESVGRNAAVWGAGNVGAQVGMVGGAAVGGLFFGPVGAMIGKAIGAAVGAAVAGFVAEQFVKGVFGFWPTPEKRQKDTLVREALTAFMFTPRDVTNPKIFNDHEIRKRYRARAKEVHPDRPTGSHERFQTLQVYFGIVRGLLNKRDGGGTDAKRIEKIVRSIALY